MFQLLLYFIIIYFILFMPTVVVEELGNTTFPLTLLKDYGPKTLNKLRWLHFPRTGVTFANTILRYSCETINQHVPLNLMEKFVDFQPWRKDPTCHDRLVVPVNNNWFSHFPLRVDDSGLAVAMFRNPGDRLASQLRWMRSMLGMVTLYGVADYDVGPLNRVLNTIPDPALFNSSHPCSRVKSQNEARLCR